ncbi:7773_t:CDS:2 [Dentiscutata erythropus]|uniref:7773_t:CDS:1 n=1 Tax=Dentiscutata erythropus TaxID=1348616 RepID=A0A9N8VC39_9GLOM|nr:7773_t:CDS:2 [Dentiscutata erythropus]
MTYSHNEQSGDVEEESNVIIEELTFDPHVTALLLPYRKYLKECKTIILNKNHKEPGICLSC